MQLLGFGLFESVYVAIAMTFSSTIIIVKLLSEQKELHSLHGKVALGILIAQDLVAIFVLIFMAGLAGNLPLSELVPMITGVAAKNEPFVAARISWSGGLS